MINLWVVHHYSLISVLLTTAYSSVSEAQHWFLFPSTLVETVVPAPKSQTVNLMDKTDASFFSGRGNTHSSRNHMTPRVCTRRRLWSERVHGSVQVSLLKLVKNADGLSVCCQHIFDARQM